MARSKNTAGAASTLRIIGGQWRSRKLQFAPAPGLRPTSDRIRETLFNWLAPTVAGSHCADLFTGSGALGLEALSRGAAHCDFVDTSKLALQHVSQHLSQLDATALARCHRQMATDFVASTTAELDIVFIDPPFATDLVNPVVQALSLADCLAPEAWVYIEMPRNRPPPNCPDHWLLHRDKAAGDVAYRLFQVTKR